MAVIPLRTRRDIEFNAQDELHSAIILMTEVLRDSYFAYTEKLEDQCGNIGTVMKRLGKLERQWTSQGIQKIYRDAKRFIPKNFQPTYGMGKEDAIEFLKFLLKVKLVSTALHDIEILLGKRKREEALTALLPLNAQLKRLFADTGEKGVQLALGNLIGSVQKKINKVKVIVENNIRKIDIRPQIDRRMLAAETRQIIATVLQAKEITKSIRSIIKAKVPEKDVIRMLKSIEDSIDTLAGYVQLDNLKSALSEFGRLTILLDRTNTELNQEWMLPTFGRKNVDIKLDFFTVKDLLKKASTLIINLLEQEAKITAPRRAA